MKGFIRVISCVLALYVTHVFADNQTNTISPVLSETNLPFSVIIEKANFQLPVGLQSGLIGTFKGNWIYIAGRLNGLHGFGGDPFPINEQNTSIYVINPNTGSVIFRSLKDPSSGLNQRQIDSLSVTAPQGYQEGTTYYMTGGYGIDTSTNTFITMPYLTAINLPGIFQWVTEPLNTTHSVIKNISQIENPIFQVTGGKMFKLGRITQLVFGQNFTGVYTPGSNGDYTEQVRRFQIIQNGGQVGVSILDSRPLVPNPNYRRRDLNIIPAMLNINGLLEYALVAFAGVFTESGGAWTVPVLIRENSDPVMVDANSQASFKQAMNQYDCATTSMYSKKNANMYNLFFGGISYGFFVNGIFQTDSELPFINQVTTIKMDKKGNFSQYIMNNEYPVILSTQANPGNRLIFGAEAHFMPSNILLYPNDVISLDSIREPTVIGHIVGGIQSTLPNTNNITDTAASPYVFKVTLIPK